jgi:hypothetical protein
LQAALDISNIGTLKVKTSTGWIFNQAKEQVTVNFIRGPSPVTIRKLERPNSPLGGTTVRGLRMYLTGLGS